jgi:molybdate transport system substrate-binding protein
MDIPKGSLRICIVGRVTGMKRILAVLAVGAITSGVAQAQTVAIYAAGSLRGVVGELSKEAGAAFNITVTPTFGGSGALRERIEKGEKPDLFLSADVGSPLKLGAEGRTFVPVAAFARNRICVVSRRSSGLTQANLVDQLLASDARLKTSTPIADPSGDYAWAIFDRIDRMRPGSGAILKAKAQAAMNAVATPQPPSQSAAAALFASHQIDMSITYCSGSASLEQELPELTSLEVPPQLDPHPLYGMAVLSSKPEVLRLALYLLSGKGQAIIAAAGLVPVVEMPPASPQ